MKRLIATIAILMATGSGAVGNGVLDPKCEVIAGWSMLAASQSAGVQCKWSQSDASRARDAYLEAVAKGLQSIDSEKVRLVLEKTFPAPETCTFDPDNKGDALAFLWNLHQGLDSQAVRTEAERDLAILATDASSACI
jgi:hypothetical protein